MPAASWLTLKRQVVPCSSPAFPSGTMALADRGGCCIGKQRVNYQGPAAPLQSAQLYQHFHAEQALCIAQHLGVPVSPAQVGQQAPAVVGGRQGPGAALQHVAASADGALLVTVDVRQDAGRLACANLMFLSIEPTVQS